MDSRQFDTLVRAVSERGTRRGLLGLLATLPILGGLCARFPLLEIDAEAKGRRKRPKKRHKHGRPRSHGQRKRGRCKPDSKARTCAGGKCGPVQNNCKKTVDCGACICGDVCEEGCQFTTVQAAIDGLPADSTIRVCAGTYGAITIDKNLTLVGVGDGDNPASNTILDAAQQGRVVLVDSGVTATLQGLRITGGSSTDPGGGILNRGDLTMSGCTVTGNDAPNTPNCFGQIIGDGCA